MSIISKPLPEPFSMAENEFVEGAPGRLDIDDIFGKTLDRVLNEFARYSPDDLFCDLSQSAQPSLFNDGYFFRDVAAGVLAFGPDGRIAGAYLSCDLSVAYNHQGIGLGAELVIERCLRSGNNPVLNLDVSSYSRAGLGAHRSAWRHAQDNPDEIHHRLKRWNGKHG